MSKKNTPISIYKNDTNFNKVMRYLKRGNKLTDQLEYRVDGKIYFEYIDIDIANGNFGRSTKVEKFTQNAQGEFVTVPVVGEELKKLQGTDARANTIGAHIQSLRALEGADEALTASGMLVHAEGDQSWTKIPLPDGSADANVDTDDNVNKIQPAEIFGNYSDIFNKHLKYPVDMYIGGDAGEENEGSQDYIFIEQFLYKAPQAGMERPKFETNSKGELEDTTDLLGNILDRGVSRGSNILGDPKGSCILPIPNRLGVSQGVNWGEARANAVQLGAFQAASAATANVAEDIANGRGPGLVGLVRDGFNQAKSVFNTVSDDMARNDGSANAGAVINAVIAKSVLGRIGINVDTEQFLTRETGAAINPNLELLFGGPQLRTFSFVFNFAPNSVEEAKVVRQIQRWFRQGMLPQKTTYGGGGGSLFLGSPNVFRVCYKNNKRRIRGLNTFKICACTSVEIDFTPDGVYQSYEDDDARSMPVRSTMKLDFNELTPIFANDYNLDDSTVDDQSLADLGMNILGNNDITEDDLGF
jgi:hypothetical protein